MSYQQERDQFLDRMAREGLPFHVSLTLLRLATTINRLAEMACSSEAADRDRIPCPADFQRTRKPAGPCLCDRPDDGHETIPRIRLQDHRAETRARNAVPNDWRVITAGDPRGYTLRVIPPSYATRNEGRDPDNLDAIGVPARDSGIRW